VFLDITGSIKDGYQSWKRWTADYETRIEEKIDKDFWKEEWRKAYSPIKAEKE
jgi:hypothetical protein